MERNKRYTSKKDLLLSKEKPLNRKHLSELIHLAVSLKEKPSKGLKRLQNILQRAGAHPDRYSKRAGRNRYRSCLGVMGGIFLAYVNLLTGKLESLNTKADEVLKIIKS